MGQPGRPPGLAAWVGRRRSRHVDPILFYLVVTTWPAGRRAIYFLLAIIEFRLVSVALHFSAFHLGHFAVVTITRSMRQKGTGTLGGPSAGGANLLCPSSSMDIAPANPIQGAGAEDSKKASLKAEEALARLSSVFASGGGMSQNSEAMLRDIERYSKEFQASLGGKTPNPLAQGEEAGGALEGEGGSDAVGKAVEGTMEGTVERTVEAAGEPAAEHAVELGLVTDPPPGINQLGVLQQLLQVQQQLPQSHFQSPSVMIPAQQPMQLGSDMMHLQLQSLLKMHLDWQMQQMHQGMPMYPRGAPHPTGPFQQLHGHFPAPPADFMGAGLGTQYHHQPPYGGQLGRSHVRPAVGPRNDATMPLESKSVEDSEFVDSNVAALCLLAMERGEDKCLENAGRKGGWEELSNANPPSRPREKKRGRPPKNPLSRTEAWERKAAAGSEGKESPNHRRAKSCKYVGVRMRKWGTFASEIRNPNSGSREWLGTFETAEEAAVVYDVRLRMIRGSGATRTNFPPLSPSPVMLTRVINPHGASRPEREEIQIPSDWLDQILAHKTKLEEFRSID